MQTYSAAKEIDAAHEMAVVVQKMIPAELSGVLFTAEEDVLAFMAFPKAQWTRIYSTNVLERLIKELKRRTKVVEIFPDIPSAIRLVEALLVEADDEW